MFRLRTLAIFFGSVALVACGKATGGSSSSTAAGSATITSAAPAPKGGSCNEEKTGLCTEFSENPLGMAEGACKSMFNGTYSKEACPKQNLLGTCEVKDEKKLYYFGNGIAPWVEDARKDCEGNVLSPGKFTAEAGVEQTAKDRALPTADRILASCRRSDGTCEDVIGRSLGADLEKGFCEDLGGKYGTTACPTEDLAGSCLKHGKVSRVYGANLKTGALPWKDVTENCEDSISQGHFYPGPAAPKTAAKAPAAAKAKK